MGDLRYGSGEGERLHIAKVGERAVQLGRRHQLQGRGMRPGLSTGSAVRIGRWTLRNRARRCWSYITMVGEQYRYVSEQTAPAVFSKRTSATNGEDAAPALANRSSGWNS